jgi:hypothetical protein
VLIFVIGPSGVGKSTQVAPFILAELSGCLASKPVLVEAGGWCRAAVAPTPTETLVQRLTEYAVATLRARPSAAVDWVRAHIEHAAVGVVVGVRNPIDFAQLFDPRTDIVVLIGGHGARTATSRPQAATAFEAHGITAIHVVISWAAEVGMLAYEPVRVPVTAAGYAEQLSHVDLALVCSAAATGVARAPRHLAPLPSRVRVAVERRWLLDLDPGAEGWEIGWLVALESYQGHFATGMFCSDSGGTFHDLPLEAMRAELDAAPEDRVDTDTPSGAVYSRSERGRLVVEPLPPDLTTCTIYDRERGATGSGTSIALVHWPEGNTLLHLVITGDRLLLWPPHKLLFGPGPLPEWRKKHDPECMPTGYKLEPEIIGSGQTKYGWSRQNPTTIQRGFSTEAAACADAHRHASWSRRRMLDEP